MPKKNKIKLGISGATSFQDRIKYEYYNGNFAILLSEALYPGFDFCFLEFSIKLRTLKIVKSLVDRKAVSPFTFLRFSVPNTF